jgi:hypothetical protein
MTDDESRYIADLDPDTYDVIAEANGFKASYRKSIPIARDARTMSISCSTNGHSPSALIGARNRAVSSLRPKKRSKRAA